MVNNIVTIENPEPIGLVKLTYHAQIPDEALTGTMLNKLYFLSNSTGKGNGKTIFKQIEALAKTYGDDSLWLDVLAENTSAVHFYQANGMHKVKEIIFSRETQQSLEFIMSKTL